MTLKFSELLAKRESCAATESERLRAVRLLRDEAEDSTCDIAEDPEVILCTVVMGRFIYTRDKNCCFFRGKKHIQTICEEE